MSCSISSRISAVVIVVGSCHPTWACSPIHRTPLLMTHGARVEHPFVSGHLTVPSRPLGRKGQ